MRRFILISYLRKLFIAVWLLLSSQIAKDVMAFSVSKRIEIQPSPLIGGPSWLALHCQVVVDGNHVFDFVPQNATSIETLKNLVMLQPVPAVARVKRHPSKLSSTELSSENEDKREDGLDTLYVSRAVEFCRNYDKDLHLVTNNCWKFAFDLVQHIRQSDENV
jgi:hypothetical protein